MNRLRNNAAILGSIFLGLATNAPASHNSYEDYARVISAKPIYETVEVILPHEECWTEQTYGHSDYPRHRHAHNDSYTAPLAGALLGGVIGNQFGGGDGKTALTVGGALLGAAIGDDIADSREYYRPSGLYHSPQSIRRCETVDHRETREEVIGYRVKYRYKGETYYTRMERDPGDTLRVRVSVRPIE
jgi:uncharacterized protein YcfJ